MSQVVFEDEPFTKESKSDNFKWSSKWQYITINLVTAQHLNSYYILINGNTSQDNFNFYQLLLAYIFIGIPCCYMQVILGQYTNLGIFSLKQFMPLANGLSYSCCLNLYMTSIIIGVTMETYVLYMGISLKPVIDWLVCPKQHKNICWQRSDSNTCNTTCISETIKVSAYVYWNKSYMNQPLPLELTTVGSPDFMRLWGSLVAWTCVYAIYTQGFPKIVKIVRVTFTLTCAFTVLLLFLLFCAYSVKDALISLFKANLHSFITLRAWNEATHRTVWLLGLGGFSHILYGTFTTSMTPTGTIVCITVFLNLTLVLLNSFMFRIAERTILTVTGMKPNQYKVLHIPESLLPDVLYIPTVLGYCSAAKLWILIYFIMLCLSSLNRMVLCLSILEFSISERLPMMLNYIKYIGPIACIAGFIGGILFQSREAYELYWDMRSNSLHFHDHLNMSLLAVFVCYVYGIQRLCDDIHFIHRKPPLKFWKIMWLISPIILVGSLNYVYLNPHHPLFNFRLGFFIIFYSAILIFGIHQIFEKLKKKKLISLFLPSSSWGPPNLEDKKKRLLFNPRMETHMERINFSCQHKCLIKNKILKKIVDKEVNVVYLVESNAF